MLLRESIATTSCRTTMIAHVSDAPAHHAETLSTVQLAARVHRLRRKKAKVGPCAAAHVACPGCCVIRSMVGDAMWGFWVPRPPQTLEQWDIGTTLARGFLGTFHRA